MQTWEFCPLPARPMVVHELPVAGKSASELEAVLSQIVNSVEPDAILRLRLHGSPDDDARLVLGAQSLRALIPDTMNIEAVLVDERPGAHGSSQ